MVAVLLFSDPVMRKCLCLDCYVVFNNNAVVVMVVNAICSLWLTPRLQKLSFFYSAHGPLQTSTALICSRWVVAALQNHTVHKQCWELSFSPTQFLFSNYINKVRTRVIMSWHHPVTMNALLKSSCKFNLITHICKELSHYQGRKKYLYVFYMFLQTCKVTKQRFSFVSVDHIRKMNGFWKMWPHWL